MTKVLVADDDSGFSAAIARHLVASGYQVKTVGSVKEATHLLGEEHIDVVLTDLRMGDRDGIDLLAACKDARWPARAILMSAYATAKDYETAIKLGAVRVLCKPFTPQELVQAIREAVECETGFHGSLHGVSLVDILQMFHYGRRNATITIGGTLPGRIHVEAGQIVHADTEKDRGEKALIALLQARSGSVRTTVLSSEERTIKRSFDALLLDLLRVIDETAKSVPPPAVANDFDGWDFGSVRPTPLAPDGAPTRAPPALPPTVPPVPFRSEETNYPVFNRISTAPPPVHTLADPFSAVRTLVVDALPGALAFAYFPSSDETLGIVDVEDPEAFAPLARMFLERMERAFSSSCEFATGQLSLAFFQRRDRPYSLLFLTDAQSREDRARFRGRVAPLASALFERVVDAR